MITTGTIFEKDERQEGLTVGQKELLKKFDGYLKGLNECRVTVVLDWLSVLFIDGLNYIPEPQETNESVVVNDRITLVYTGKGTEHFKYIYNLHYNGEHLASIVCHTRNVKFIKLGVVKIDFKNHLLYSSDLWPIYNDIVESMKLEYKNISRVDIAIDGMNYMLDFLNQFVKQERAGKVIELKGRPTFSAKVLDRRTMYYQNFLIGGGNGRKVITVYNKSLDIVKTGKDYIQKFWQANGMMNELLPLELIAKTMNDEKLYIEGYDNVFRFEMRLRGEKIKEIEGFKIEMLQDPNKMVSILKLMTRNFFEFAIRNDPENISRCTDIEVIPFQKFKIVNLAKVERLERDDLYKTKLSIKKNVRQLYLGKLMPEDMSVLEMLLFDIKQFSLENWFKNKVGREWDKQFSELNPNKEHIESVRLLMTNITNTVFEDEANPAQLELL